MKKLNLTRDRFDAAWPWGELAGRWALLRYCVPKMTDDFDARADGGHRTTALVNQWSTEAIKKAGMADGEKKVERAVK